MTIATATMTPMAPSTKSPMTNRMAAPAPLPANIRIAIRHLHLHLVRRIAPRLASAITTARIANPTQDRGAKARSWSYSRGLIAHIARRGVSGADRDKPAIKHMSAASAKKTPARLALSSFGPSWVSSQSPKEVRQDYENTDLRRRPA